MNRTTTLLALLLPAACTHNPPPFSESTAPQLDSSLPIDSGPEPDTGVETDTEEDTGEVAVPHTYRCTPIGHSDGDGIFSLRAFSGQLYAGLFGYGRESHSMVSVYPPWELASPGLKGISESVCAMLEYEGYLYANTESSGDIFRSANGTHWERVYDGPGHTIGCGLEAFGGHLYAVNYDNRDKRNGRILRSSSGASWETVWDSGSDSRYLREITSHNGVLYAPAVDENSLQGWMLSSTDGTHWSSRPTPTRFFRGHSWNGHLWLASTDRNSQGGAGIWRYDAAGPVQVYQATKHYVTEITHFDGALFAGTSDGWKGDQGESSLLMSRDGEAWESVCSFPEIAAWSIATLGEHLFVGTWEYGARGQLYRVDAIAPTTAALDE